MGEGDWLQLVGPHSLHYSLTLTQQYRERRGLCGGGAAFCVKGGLCGSGGPVVRVGELCGEGGLCGEGRLCGEGGLEGRGFSCSDRVSRKGFSGGRGHSSIIGDGTVRSLCWWNTLMHETLLALLNSLYSPAAAH